MRYLKALWVAAAIVILAVTLYYYNPMTGRDADILMIYGMLALGVPSSILVAGVVGLVAYTEQFTGLSVLNSRSIPLAIILVWSAFAAVGYVQWFKLLPSLIRGRERLRESSK
jgi:hypothetical protein